MEDLRYKAFIQESEALTEGFRSDIRGLCTSFFSKSLIPDTIHHRSTDRNANEVVLVGDVLRILQARVKHEGKVFDDVVGVLQSKIGMEYLGGMLKKRLRTVQQELEVQQIRDMAQAKAHEMVVGSGKGGGGGRPVNLDVASTRRVESAVSCSTEPAAANKFAKLPQEHFLSTRGANSVGSEGRMLPGGGVANQPSPAHAPTSNSSSPMYPPPVPKTHHRDHSRDQIVMNRVQFHPSTLPPPRSSPPPPSSAPRYSLSPLSSSMPVTGDLLEPEQRREGGAQSGGVRKTGGLPGMSPVGLAGKTNHHQNTTVKPGEDNEQTQPPPPERKSMTAESKGQQHPPAMTEDAAATSCHLWRNNSVYPETNGHKRPYSGADSDFVTPPSSPRATPPVTPKATPTVDKLEFETGASCGECYQMKRKISLLEKKLGNLELSKETDMENSQTQIENLKSELSNVSQQKYQMEFTLTERYKIDEESQRRHQEQNMLINSLQEQIEKLTRQRNDAQTCQRRMEQARKLEKVQREKECYEKQQLQWEKDEACRQKMRYMEEAAKLKERNLQMNEKIMSLYGELRRANSMQCDEQPTSLESLNGGEGSGEDQGHHAYLQGEPRSAQSNPAGHAHDRTQLWGDGTSNYLAPLQAHVPAAGHAHSHAHIQGEGHYPEQPPAGHAHRQGDRGYPAHPPADHTHGHAHQQGDLGYSDPAGYSHTPGGYPGHPPADHTHHHAHQQEDRGYPDPAGYSHTPGGYPGHPPVDHTYNHAHWQGGEIQGDHSTYYQPPDHAPGHTHPHSTNPNIHPDRPPDRAHATPTRHAHTTPTRHAHTANQPLGHSLSADVDPSPRQHQPTKAYSSPPLAELEM